MDEISEEASVVLDRNDESHSYVESPDTRTCPSDGTPKYSFIRHAI